MAAGLPYKTMPKATLINPQGQKVVVESGSPDAQNYFGQGYTLMGANIPPVVPQMNVNDLVGQTSGKLNEAISNSQAPTFTDLTPQLNEIYSNITKQLDSINQAAQPTGEMASIGSDIAGKQTQITNLDTGFQQGMNKIENQAIPMPFITGQQASVQRNYNQQRGTLVAEESNLLNRLGLAQDAQKANLEAQKFGLSSLFDVAGLQMKAQDAINQQKQQVFQNAQTLTQNAQNTLANILERFQGIDPDTLTAEATAQLTQLAQEAGIDPQLLFAGMRTVKDQIDFDQSIKLMGAAGQGGISASTKVSLIANLVSTGLSVSEATKQVNQIIGAVGGATGETPSPTEPGKSRTDRNNNPTAMTTDVAKTLGLKEGTDYTQGDPFQTEDGKTLYTAKLTGDGFDATIKGLDLAANNPNTKAFFTAGGTQRWTHTAMTDTAWLLMTPEQKKATVTEMYKRENGPGGSLFQESGGNMPTDGSKYNQQVIDAANLAHKLGNLGGVDSKILGNVRSYMADQGWEIPSDKPQTAEQTKAAGFYDRGKPANDILNSDKVANYISGLGTFAFYLNQHSPNFMKPGDFQAFEQARRQFTEAYLRRDSGAAISATEYENADKTYFPQPGDTKETVAQKKIARQTVLDSLIKEAGKTTPTTTPTLTEEEAYQEYLKTQKK
jgi:hypothetical protein